MTKKTEKTKKKEKKPSLHFKSEFPVGKDYMNLNVEYSPELQEILKKASVNGLVEFRLFQGNAENGEEQSTKLNRTRVKTIIYNGFKNDGRDLLFIEDLIKDGKFSFKFYDVVELEKTIDRFTINIHRAIELINTYSNISKKVTFNIE